MIKKIFCFIACFMLVLSCVFISPITVNASTGQTYTYDDSEVYSDTSNLGNYAITSVESLNIEGSMVYKVSFTLSQVYKFRFLSSSSDTSTYTGNFFTFNAPKNLNTQWDLNFAVRCLTSDTGLTFSNTSTQQGTINGTRLYRRELTFSSLNSYEFYFSTVCIDGTFANMVFNDVSDYSKLYSSSYSSDLDSFIDMNSETNFSFDSWVNIFSQSSNDLTLSSIFLAFLMVDGSVLPSFSFASSLSSLSSFDFYANNVRFRMYKNNNQLVSGAYVSYLYEIVGGNLSTDYSVSLSNYFNSFYFLINRPVYRTNNTLIIYNFDYYGFVSSVSSVTYQLQKGLDKYNVVYNGSLPNSSFIYVHNPKVANMLFDEYIYLYLAFDKTTGYYDVSSGSFDSDFSLGFDFNFTYYNEPLVSSNGSYNFDFQKPGYVEMRFSLSPFYIPILEAVQNALIFLLFYCPIISDILSFIHLDQFFGALFNIFGFETGNITLLGINMGSFIWACISFLIFFKLLRSFMPILWSSRAEASSSWSDLMSKPDKLKEKERIAHHKEIYRKHKENLKAKKSDEVKIRGRVYSKKYLNSLYDNIDDIDL